LTNFFLGNIVFEICRDPASESTI